MMTSQQLAALLRQQALADNGTIKLCDATLGTTGIDALVKSDLQRRDGILRLTVDPASIPTDPPAAGFSLTVAVPGDGDGFLDLDDRAATIAFAVGASTIDLALSVTARQNASGAAVPWVFSTSFPELVAQPYDDLDLATPTLVFATGGANPGLSFAGQLQAVGVFAALATLMGLSGRFQLAGAITRDTQGNLSFKLEASLGLPSFGITSIIELQSPRIGVSYAATQDSDGQTDISVRMYMAATSNFGAEGDRQVSVDIYAPMPIVYQGSRLLQLSVMPNKFSTSLGNLGSLVAGQSWDNFFDGPAAELKPYFDTFGFLGYSMTFTTRAKVTGLALSVGTLKPWQLFGSYQLTLDGTWSVIFLNGTPVQTLALHAGFDYEGKMGFDVTVTLPNLHISGRQSGDPLTMTLKGAADKLFGSGALAIPDDLLTISVGNFSIDIDKPSKTLSFGLVADASFSLFGAQLLALHQMAVGVLVDASGPTKTYTGTIDGQISLGPITAQVNAVLSNDPSVGCVFTVHLVNETVGSMLGHLVHLVDPTLDISFGEPWDKLLDISLDAFVLKVDVTKKTVAIAYETDIDLGFLRISSLGLSWQHNAQGPSTTNVEISGRFLGTPMGGSSGNPPLAWDPINENPPAVPGAGDKILDLRYLGIGQHVGFDPSWKPTNMEDVIAKMEALAQPAGGSNLPNLTSPGGLRFAKDSGWLLGADFTIMGTVQLGVVFNDPNLYGVLIALAGEKAKSFAGLKFEILYRKVTDTIGVYHIELKLPDAMRHLEFGEVSLTLPVVVLDIYTNGNFRVDLGFPKKLDFSGSFCLQVFPFLGYGGFYFALLNGETSSRVPRISNGTFNPVIEFGIALAVGVGKTIDEGVLSGGLSVTVVGILEGVLGWFHPTDTSVPSAEYYWLQGTAAITGRLYGSVDFVIIQASVSVTAYASVTLVIECYQPIYISMSVGVSVEVSVKIVFFTIHLSFGATISTSFTIGSASQPPWAVIGPPSSKANQLFARRGSLHQAQHRMFAGLARHDRLASMALRLANGDVALQWSARTVFPTRTLPLHVMPAFTKTATGVAGVLLLGLENGIDARAGSLAAHRLTTPGAAPPGIGDLLEGLARWAIANARVSLGKSPTDGVVDADDVALLSRAFADDAALARAMDYHAYLDAFLHQNFSFTLTAPAAGNSDTGVSLFPMPPALVMTAGDAKPVDFSGFNAQDGLTLQKMRAYFDLLAVDYEQFVAQQNGGDAAKAAATGAGTPIAQVVFEQYMAMQMRAVVKACGDVLHRYAFTLTDKTKAFGLAEIRSQLSAPGLPASAVVGINRDKAVLAPQAVLVLEDVHHQTKLGDSFASVAATLNAVLPSSAQLTGAQIASVNLDAAGLFNLGTAVTVTGTSWTTLVGESLNLIVTRQIVRALPATTVQQFPGVQVLAQALLAANPGLFPDAPMVEAINQTIDPVAHPQVTLSDGGTYQVAAGDTLVGIAALQLAARNGYVSIDESVAWVLAHNTLTITDPGAAQPTGTVLALAPLLHAIEAGETIGSLAARLLTTTDVVIASLLAVPAAVSLLAPHALLALPTLRYAIGASDTFATIADRFNLTLQAIEEAIGTEAVFAPGAAIDVAEIFEMGLDPLVDGLAASQWSTIAPMASRFMLSGLRLPDPADPVFQRLSLADMSVPANLGAISTLPLYGLTGQQFSIPAAPPASYAIVLKAAADSPAWLPLATPLSLGLNADQLAVIAKLAAATFAPAVQFSALPHYRLAATRYTLQTHLSWQPATLPAQAVYDPASLGIVAGNPDLWLFPDQLTAKLNADGTNQAPYTVAIGTHQNADGMTVNYARGFAWGTMLRLTVQQLPSDQASAPAGATIVGMVGTDDSGIALLDALTAQLQHDDATLFLLYPPNPASNSGGVLSDQLGAATALMQVNLSTLSHSGAALAAERSPLLTDAATGAPLHVAPITKAGAFLRLLRDCSIVRSGGYYLNYVNANGGAGLPASLFTSGPTAELTLLVVLASQNAAHAAILPFNNCAVVADNIDAASSNVFVQSPTWLVSTPASLSDAAAAALSIFGLTLDAADIATLNADVPQLLRPGAQVQLPASQGGTATVLLNDTLSTLAARYGMTPATLAAYGTNALADILVPTALVQFHPDSLTQKAAIPAGSAGFQLTRANPDPGNTRALTAADTGEDILDELFHMLSHRIVVDKGAAFLRSGEGVPVGPSQSRPTENGGAAPSDQPTAHWDYHQAVTIAPFAVTHHGSASPALPLAAESPYAGVGPTAEITFAFAFQDPFGNTLPLPDTSTLSQPVRYFDDLASPGQWPSSGLGYCISGDGSSDPLVTVSLSMHTDKYLPGPSQTSDRAARNVDTDLKSYLRAYYQLSQPDVGFTLTTTLDPDTNGAPTVHTLPVEPFRDFVTAAWVMLDALDATQPVMWTASDATTTLGSVADTYSVSPADLLVANGGSLYSALFGANELSIPQLATTVAGDSLALIATAQKIDPAQLALQNPWAPLSTTVDLTVPPRTVTPVADATLADIAASQSCSISGLALANASLPLTDGLTLSVAGLSLTTAGDDFTSLPAKFAALGLPSITIAEIAVSNQTVPGLFRAPASLSIADAVPQAGDSLGTIAQRLSVAIDTLAKANEAVADLFAPGTSLYVGPGTVAAAPAAGTTLAQFATAQEVPLAALGLALYQGLQPATPPAMNRGVTLADGAILTIPATVTNPGIDRHAPYRAQSGDATLADIAAKFAGNDVGALGTLNVDLPGLFQAGTTVTDAASGKTTTTAAESTFASLVAAFAAEGVTVTPASLCHDNQTVAKLVRPGGLWLCPPMVVAQDDSLKAIASRYGVLRADGSPDVALVARTNAAVLGFLAAGVTLSFNGQTLTTTPNDTLNSLAARFARPGAQRPSVDELATTFADEPMMAAGSLILPFAVGSSVGVTITPSFTTPIAALGVTVTESRLADWVADDFKGGAAQSAVFEVPPQIGSDGEVLALDAFATAVETALPGMRVATGDAAGETDPADQRRLWLVNFGGSGPQAIGFQFEGGQSVRSFAIPPLSTALASDTFLITPYVSGQGLSGTPVPQVFASIDLDVWGAQFLAAMDLMLSPTYAVPAAQQAETQLETILTSKRTLAKSIAGRVQYVLDGGEPGLYGEDDPRRADAIGAMEQALLTTLSSAYAVNSLVQATVDVRSPYTDAATAPRLSGRAVLTQPATAAPVRNMSLSTAKVPLAATATASPVPASFLLTVQSPATDRSPTVEMAYSVAEIEVPAGQPDPDGYQSSYWLTLVHPLDDGRGQVGQVTLPVPLRNYPLPPTLTEQTATAQYASPQSPDQLTRWSAAAVYSRQDADQDTGQLRLEVGVSQSTAAGNRLGEEDDIFAALAQFVAVYSALRADLALLPLSAPGSSGSATTVQAVTAFATIASAVAQAWPTTAVIPRPPLRLGARVLTDDTVPGIYAYSLQHPETAGPDLTWLTLNADPANPAPLWPDLAVDSGDGSGFRTMAKSSPQGAAARYDYPVGITKGLTLKYQVTLPNLDAVMIPDTNTGVAVKRNAELVDGSTTCPLFVYSTPYSTFSSPLVPLLSFDTFTIGSGAIGALAAALETFLTGLLHRNSAASGSSRVLRVAAGFVYDAIPGGTAAGLTTYLPMVLAPSVELVINGTSTTAVAIADFSAALAEFIVDWDHKVGPSHVNASVAFDVALFSQADASNNKPLLEVASVRYSLS